MHLYLYDTLLSFSAQYFLPKRRFFYRKRTEILNTKFNADSFERDKLFLHQFKSHRNLKSETVSDTDPYSNDTGSMSAKRLLGKGGTYD
jgi:hypothetical protein